MRSRRWEPLFQFVLLTFLIAYTIGFALLWFQPTLPDPLGQYVPRIGVTYAPATAALLVAGRRGAGGLLRKLNPRGQWRWALVVIAAGIVCTAAAALITGVGLPVSPWLAAHLLLQFVFVGCGEELGWRGWLLPQLLKRYSLPAATAIVAAIWGCWHMPILMMGWRTTAPFLFGVFGLSFLFTALWERVNGNIFVLAMAHAGVNAPLSALNNQSVTDAVFVLYGILGTIAFIRLTVRSAPSR
jgi:membrane protease YdiL (CAAX protease family)